MLKQSSRQTHKSASRFCTHRVSAIFHYMLAAAFCLTLAACSGGSGGSGTHTVTATAGSGGTINPASIAVNNGSTTTFTVTPDTGYLVASFTGCNGSLNGNTYTTGTVTADCTVTASFVVSTGTTHTVTATAGVGGTVNPVSVTVNDGSTTDVTITPDVGYAIGGVTGCGGTLSGTIYTTGAITADCTVTASFIVTHTVTATAGVGGIINPSSATVNDGSTATFGVTPNVGYAISSVTGCGGTLSGNTYTTGAITADCSVTATFIVTHTVTATAGTGGTINPSSISVNDGSTTSFSVTPDVSYKISNVTGCGGTLSGTTYTTGEITADCTVNATFIAVNQWTWSGGAHTVDAIGVYGTPGANIPGARDRAAVWTDSSGRLWLYGGFGYDSLGAVTYLNDLWRYDPATAQWTWINGYSSGGNPGVYGTLGTPASNNVPGACYGAAAWMDGSGNLWLFGGYGYDSGLTAKSLNDLWEYDPGTDKWTWMGGSSASIGSATGVYGTQGTADPANIPGARYRAAAWTDTANGYLWLFGGRDPTVGYLNDLWKYDLVAKQWTWMAGSNTFNSFGTSGTQGTPDAANTPGARYRTTAWTDTSGHLWLFGGNGYGSTTSTGVLNDLWQFDPSLGSFGEWAWMGGSDVANIGATGTYGTMGIADSANLPGARESAAAWSDSNGHLWLFGGHGYDANGSVGELNDLWQYDLTTNQWTWIGGLDTTNGSGTYGTLNTADPANIPGARDSGAYWSGTNGRLWLFGGNGYDSTGSKDYLNDLWLYQP